MFTGIILERGAIRKAQNRRGLLELEINAPRIARELKVGDSIAINGVCLTAVSTSRKRFLTQAMPETLARSTLASLKKGAGVNLELPARLVDRLGGHLVQGHVDGIARVVRTEPDADALRVWFSAGQEVLRYLVPKGSVTLDGVSLTVTEVGETTFQVALVPHTLEVTTFKDLKMGSEVNVEVDVIAKYVERLTDGRYGGR